MRFAFTEDQLAFRRAVREFFERECPPAYVRAWVADGDPSQLWKGLAALGVVGLTVPERFGGLGLGELELVLVLEEAGRAALPEPLAETTAVAAPLIREAADEDIQAEWLPRVAAGEAILSIRRGSGSVAIPEIDLEVTAHAAEAAFDRGALATSAVLCGIADRVIEMAASYAKERHQFGKPIGSFQAVKHLLADALLGLDFARPAVYRAAWSVANASPDRSRDVSMAKALASDAAVNACRSALQVHGAIGYTHEHDLHLWLNKGFILANAWGTAAWHRERVARAVLDSG